MEDMPMAPGSGHGAMAENFRRRFLVCLVLTVPVLILSETIQDFLGLGGSLRFSG